MNFRYLVRGFRRSPGFFLTAVVTIALGIGAGSAVFSVVDRILFRPLPYQDEAALVWLGMKAPILADTEFVLGGDFPAMKKDQTPFQSMTAVRGPFDCNLLTTEALKARCARVDPDFFPTMRLSLRLGRNFTPEEDRFQGPAAAIISNALWMERYGGRDSVLEQSLTIDGSPARIVGVLPADFEMPSMQRPDVLLPQQIDWKTQLPGQGTIILFVYARLKDGVSLARAEAELHGVFEQALQNVPQRFRKEVSFQIYSLRDRQIRDARLASLLLLAAVACLLLISCLNVANLLIARAAGRRQEFAIRTAIGATRGALVRQMLEESLTLGLAGGFAGLGLGWILLRIFVAISPAGIPRLDQAVLDWRVTVASLATAVLAGLVFGVFPAFKALQLSDLGGSRSTARVRQALVAVQLAVSLVLLAGAGLLAQSLWKMQRVRLGFQPERLVAGSIQLDRNRYGQPERSVAFFDALEAGLKSVPGVESVALSDSLPPAGLAMAMIYSNIRIEGKPSLPEGTGGMITHRSVTPGYFQTLGIPIVKGRGFTEADRRTANVVVLSERLAAKMFSNEDPIGKVLHYPGRDGTRTVIGVAAEVRNAGLQRESDPESYGLFLRNNGIRSAYVVVKAAGDSRSVSRIVSAEVQRLDSTVPVSFQTLHEKVRTMTAPARFQASLLGMFAIAGLLLAAVGLFGVLSYLVAQRTREIGVRVAVGATHRDIAGMILKQAGTWTVAGLAMGLVGVLAAMRPLKSLLFDVDPADPATIAAVMLLLALIAAVAAWIPARRASRIDPMRALRVD